MCTMNRFRNVLCPSIALVLTLGLTGLAHADETVQVPVDALLNGRSVTTFTGGALVSWTMGVDGGGTSDGYLTAAASKFHGDPAAIKALPDDGKFPADARHPEVILHFSNDAPPTSQQTHFLKGAGDFTFAVPAATYSKMFFFLTSSEGSSALKLTLTYADATVDVVTQTVPDYYSDIAASDPVFFYLASDLAKWNKQNNIAETAHHNLDGMEVHPSATKLLTSVKVEKSAGGYLVFWGATGIATSAVSVGADAGGADATSAEVGGGDSVAAGSAGNADAAGGSANAAGAAAGAGGTAVSGAAGSTDAGGAPGVGAGAAGAGAADVGSRSSGCSCNVDRGGGSANLLWWSSLFLGAALGATRWTRVDGKGRIGPRRGTDYRLELTALTTSGPDAAVPGVSDQSSGRPPFADHDDDDCKANNLRGPSDLNLRNRGVPAPLRPER
jgi:hypothetical protein